MACQCQIQLKTWEIILAVGGPSPRFVKSEENQCLALGSLQVLCWPESGHKKRTGGLFEDPVTLALLSATKHSCGSREVQTPGIPTKKWSHRGAGLHFPTKMGSQSRLPTGSHLFSKSDEMSAKGTRQLFGCAQALGFSSSSCLGWTQTCEFWAVSVPAQRSGPSLNLQHSLVGSGAPLDGSLTLANTVGTKYCSIFRFRPCFVSQSTS